MSEVRIIEGDCFEVLRGMADASVHAVCTDPPYGLEFMGSEWDRPWAVSATQAVGFAGREENLTLPAHGDSRNANCRTCGGRARGARRCECAEPDWDRHPREDMVALQAWNAGWLEECLRVLKPGGFLLAFSGTRTYHRLACAAEDVGFEVRDTIHWMFGSGFPKSLNVSVAIDAHLGKAGEREVVGQKHAERYPNGPGGTSFTVNGDGADGSRTAERTVETRAATSEAARYEGFGTALKPAHELILLARKPLIGTVAKNVLEHGTGGLNIDAARIPTTGDESLGGGDELASPRSHAEGWSRPWHDDPELLAAHAERVSGNVERAEALGRWPANVILSHSDGCVLIGTRAVKADGHFPAARGDGGLSTSGHGGQEGLAEAYMDGEVVEVYECEAGCPVAALDEQSGEVGAAAPVMGTEPSVPFSGHIYGEMKSRGGRGPFFGDKGGASRFFYVAKASRAERNAGLGELEEIEAPVMDRRPGGDHAARMGRERPPVMKRNHHPTVKPISLMRHLLRLVVPPDGVALDPFLGSGTTACAAALEGFSLVGIERDPGFVEIARRRHAFWAEHGERALDEMRRREMGERQRQEVVSAGQLDLFG